MTVELYTKPNCVQCEATKRDLNRRGIDFVAFDVSADEDALERATSMGHRQAPVVVADGTNWSGYRPDLIAGLVKTAATA